MIGTLPYNSFPLVINDMACISKEWRQVRFPKSKKKRIRKKWEKQRQNFGFKDIHKLIKLGDRILVSSKIHSHIMKKYGNNALL